MSTPLTLRDRIRRAICEAEGFAWDSDLLEPDEYGDLADAILAALPEPAPAVPTTGTAECGCDPVPHREDDGTYSHWAGCPVADAQQAAAAPPAPVDRAAILRERADFYEGVLRDSLNPDGDPRYCQAIHDVIIGLRRLADETPETP